MAKFLVKEAKYRGTGNRHPLLSAFFIAKIKICLIFIQFLNSVVNLTRIQSVKISEQ